jgi:hypothetical protein
VPACFARRPSRGFTACAAAPAVNAAQRVSDTQLAVRADGLLTRSPLPLQGPFPETFPLLPDLVILEMDHNRFTCVPCFWVVFLFLNLLWQAFCALCSDEQQTRQVWGAHVHLDRPRKLVPDVTVLRCRGEMPSVPGMFGLLRVFNATRNLLTGSIPRTFGAAGIFTLVSLASRKLPTWRGRPAWARRTSLLRPSRSC